MGIQEDRQEDRKGPLTGKDLSDQSSWEDLDRFERLGEKLRIHNLSMGAACNVPEDVDFVCSTPGGERLTSSAISKATQKIQIAQNEEEEKEHAHKRLLHQIEELNRQIAELEAKIAKLTEEIDALNEKLSAQEKKFKAEFGPNWREEIQKPENKNRSDVLLYNQDKETRDTKVEERKSYEENLEEKRSQEREAVKDYKDSGGSPDALEQFKEKLKEAPVEVAYIAAKDESAPEELRQAGKEEYTGVYSGKEGGSFLDSLGSISAASKIAPDENQKELTATFNKQNAEVEKTPEVTGPVSAPDGPTSIG